MTFHFFRCVEGSLDELVIRRRALLSDGRLVQYDACGRDRQATADFLRRGLWHWKYLGEGEIHEVWNAELEASSELLDQRL